MTFDIAIFLYVGAMLISSCHVADKVRARVGGPWPTIAAAAFCIVFMVPVYVFNHFWGY